LFDQRGSSRSTPFGSIENNTTQACVSDINKLLDFVGFEKAYVFGGSWGSTLALVYAIHHPELVLGLILRGIWLANRYAIDHYIGGGIKEFFPDVWERFRKLVPKGENPSKYYLNNVVGFLNLLDVMVENSCKKIILSSSAGVYGNPVKLPIEETDPKNPLNPYGETKYIMERMLEDYDNAYQIKSISLRYFNAAGAALDGTIGEAHPEESHLIPNIIIKALKEEEVEIFGDDYDTPDGTCVRDYVHVLDLVDAHALALKALEEGKDSNCYNLGIGRGYSNKEIISEVEKAANLKVKADQGKVALQRGPIVYCLEGPDNGNHLVDNFLLADDSKLFTKFEGDLLNGVSTITGTINDYIYSENELIKLPKDFKAIPYYSWAHRGKGEMTVWINRDEKYVKPVNSKTLIEQSKILSTSDINLDALNDKTYPGNSDNPTYFEILANTAYEQWIRIDFPDTAEISFVEIFWVSDLESEKIKLPSSWTIQYEIDNNYRDVYPIEHYTILKNQFSQVAFETVKTGSLKILVNQLENSPVGIYEIRMK